jgi:hypothetical protein
LVTLTHQLDTGVKFENEVEDLVEDTPRSVIIPSIKKVQQLPQVSRVATPIKPEPTEKSKNIVKTNAELKGNDIVQKIVSGQFKPIAVFNPQDLLAKDYGVQDYNGIPSRHRPPYVTPHHAGTKSKDVDLTLRIPGQYIENAVVAIVISVADAFDGTGQVVYQNVLNKS